MTFSDGNLGYVRLPSGQALDVKYVIDGLSLNRVALDDIRLSNLVVLGDLDLSAVTVEQMELSNVFVMGSLKISVSTIHSLTLSKLWVAGEFRLTGNHLGWVDQSDLHSVSATQSGNTDDNPDAQYGFEELLKAL